MKNNNVNREAYLAEQFASVAESLTAISEGRKNIIMKLLYEFRDLFSDKPGCAKGYEHRIRLTKTNTIVNKTYPVPHALRESVGECLQEMLKVGIIERATSPYCNPLRIVIKSDKTIRICLDAKYLNQFVEDDHESPPIIADLMQKFFGCKFFSKLDLTQGYWQVPLHVDSRPLTAFLFGTSMYQFTRVPFGLKTAGSAFIRALSIALESNVTIINVIEKYKYVDEEDVEENITSEKVEMHRDTSTYIDDCAIATRPFTKHLIVLQTIFSKLMFNNFTIKLRKCEFVKSQILFLGFFLSRKGVVPDPDRIKYIQTLEIPKNRRHLQQVLGVVNYFRHFVLNHNSYITPFRELLKCDTNWQWTDAHTKAFSALK